MKIISWNVNGLRSVIKNNTINKMNLLYNPDVLCLSEIKTGPQNNNTICGVLPEYPYKFWKHGNSPGKLGVAVFSKIKPIRESYFLPGLTQAETDGRYIELKFKDFYLISVYTPNSGRNLKNIKFRTEIWDPAIQKRLNYLKRNSEVIYTGDLNVVQLETDTYNFKQQRNKLAGVTDIERENFQKLLNSGYINVFREKFPDKIIYSYFTYFFQSRQLNKGMLFDYFLLTPTLYKNVESIKILTDVNGSDHLPVECTIKN